MNILIVDDIQDNLDLMEIILKSNNYQVKSALNGKAALELLQSEKFDLIISDILMPVMDGFQFCKECKFNPQLKSIPFIFYTATYIDNLDEEFALSLGAQEFIRKPQEPDIFLNIIKEVIKKAEIKQYSKVNEIEKDEKEILRLYSERLIAKLEKKNIDLENEISAHKKTVNELLIAKEKAEESDKLKTAFLRNMSHEIRTPLNGILGFSDLLNHENNSIEEIREYTNMIRLSGNRLLSIVNNVLDIARIESGQLKVVLKPLSIHSIFSDLFSLFNNLAKSKNLILSFDKNHADCVILSDEIKLNQILTNLINNAIKFTKNGSINFGYQIKDNSVIFYIHDTGIGISSEFNKKIFERFTQVEITLTREYEGAGLGLAICKGLVELLGGSIWVESKPGLGSTFFFNLPYTAGDLPKQEESVLKNEPAKPFHGKILIVEDDIVSYQYLCRLFDNPNLTILHAQNGELAVELVRNISDIDLILMDIRMPVMDGVEAINQIKDIRPGLPIIVQTAYAFREEKETFQSTGYHDYIAKPIQKEDLMKLISKYIR
ncbi:MAG: Hybrid sensor histidine kinase/response regulator [Bacteroidota bacterium]|nr:Hybrid sensor histidine kinase/response regulator [Bacteroidota bacterium]